MHSPRVSQPFAGKRLPNPPRNSANRVISSPDMTDISKAGNKSIVTSALNSNELHLSDFAETI